MTRKQIFSEIIKIKNPFQLSAFIFRYCFKELLTFMLVGTLVAIILMTKTNCEQNYAGFKIKVNKTNELPAVPK